MCNEQTNAHLNDILRDDALVLKHVGHSIFADNKQHVLGCDAVQPVACQYLLPKAMVTLEPETTQHNSQDRLH
jgi:hypothetical protein